MLRTHEGRSLFSETARPRAVNPSPTCVASPGDDLEPGALCEERQHRGRGGCAWSAEGWAESSVPRKRLNQSEFMTRCSARPMNASGAMLLEPISVALADAPPVSYRES